MNGGSASNANDSPETPTPTPRSEALEREVLSAVEAVESARADEDKDKDDASRRESKPPSPDGPLVLSPGQPGASPVGSMMFNQSVKQFFDGFRSRVTLVSQCLCFATAADANLWGPIAGGLACDVLFI